jgi:hypothetical protein
MEVISKPQAVAQGLEYYFTGRVCKNGHLSRRLVSNRNCEQCLEAYKKSYYRENVEAYKKRDAAYYRDNKDRILERQKQFFQRNPEAIKQKGLKYRQRNPEKVASIARDNYQRNRTAILDKHKERYRKDPKKAVAKVAVRRARKQNACPPWFDELDNFVWQEAADLARIRCSETGFEWHIDHMIPLAARNVCGLHVGNNCQVIPARLNLWKHNKMILTIPGEWIRHL